MPSYAFHTNTYRRRNIQFSQETKEQEEEEEKMKLPTQFWNTSIENPRNNLKLHTLSHTNIISSHLFDSTILNVNIIWRTVASCINFDWLAMFVRRYFNKQITLAPMKDENIDRNGD